MAIEGDGFSSSRSNLRETAKWLSAAFAGLSAFVIGGSPSSGLGDLPVGGVAFYVALISVVAALVALGFSLRLVLGVLSEDAVYRSDLLSNAREKEDLRSKEIQQVIDAINSRAEDLLPHNYQNLQSISDRVSALRSELAQTSGSGRETKLAELTEMNEVVNGLLGIAQYLRLQHRFEKVKTHLYWLGPSALAALLVYGIALGAGHRTTDSRIIIYNESKILSCLTLDDRPHDSKVSCHCGGGCRQLVAEVPLHPCPSTTSSTASP